MDRPQQTTKTDPTVTAGTALQVLGVIVLSVGIGLAWLWLGIAVLGAGFVLIGTSMELR